MNEKDAISIPVEEGQPLLDAHSLQGCTRGIFCKHCVTRTHKNSRKRVFIRRTVAAMLLAWLYWSVFGQPHRGGFKDDIDGRHDDRQCHRDNLVPWDGPSHFEVVANNIDFKFGKGNMATNVKVLTQDKAENPIIVIQANVTKSHRHDGDNDDDGHEGDEEIRPESVVILDPFTKEIHRHGLHVHVHEKDGDFEILVWADEYADRGRHDHEHDEDGHHHHHHRKFCANIEATIILPSRLAKFGRLGITGTVTNVNVRDISAISFDNFNILSTVGEIVFSNDDSDNALGSVSAVKAKEFSVRVTAGSVSVPSVTAPHGSPVKVKVETTVGPITLNALLSQIETDAADQEHEINIATRTGSINLEVKPADILVRNKVASHLGELTIYADSQVGGIHSTIDHDRLQATHQYYTTTTGTVNVVLTDNFLGNIRLKSEMGSAQVHEVEGSASKIVYEENTEQVKVGHKQLKKDDDEAAQRDTESEVVINAKFGTAELSFV